MKKNITAHLQSLTSHIRSERREKLSLSWECRLGYLNMSAWKADNLKGIALVLRVFT